MDSDRSPGVGRSVGKPGDDEEEEEGCLAPHLVLTLLIETHASYRGIQTCLKNLHGIDVSLGKIAGIVKEAGQRAQTWLGQQQASTPRTLALDEQYSSQRGKAYLNVIDVQSGQVWATVPPVEVDGDSWTLLLWYVQEQGISRLGTVSDGGRAIQLALTQVKGEEDHQRDVWHLFHVAAQVQGRLDRAVKTEQDRLMVRDRQAQREAQGERVRGRRPKATLTEQKALLAVWRNHQIAPRGLHKGLSPLQRTGSTSSDSTWLAALGYSCLAA